MFGTFIKAGARQSTHRLEMLYRTQFVNKNAITASIHSSSGQPMSPLPANIFLNGTLKYAFQMLPAKMQSCRRFMGVFGMKNPKKKGLGKMPKGPPEKEAKNAKLLKSVPMGQKLSKEEIRNLLKAQAEGEKLSARPKKVEGSQPSVLEEWAAERKAAGKGTLTKNEKIMATFTVLCMLTAYTLMKITMMTLPDPLAVPPQAEQEATPSNEPATSA